MWLLRPWAPLTIQQAQHQWLPCLTTPRCLMPSVRLDSTLSFQDRIKSVTNLQLVFSWRLWPSLIGSLIQLLHQLYNPVPPLKILLLIYKSLSAFAPRTDLHHSDTQSQNSDPHKSIYMSIYLYVLSLVAAFSFGDRVFRCGSPNSLTFSPIWAVQQDVPELFQDKRQNASTRLSALRS